MAILASFRGSCIRGRLSAESTLRTVSCIGSRLLGVGVSWVFSIQFRGDPALGLCPGWNDCYVEEILRVSRVGAPSLNAIDFVGDWRFVNATGAHGKLTVDMAAFLSLLDRFGARHHARDGKHGWPAKVGLWLGFVADTNESAMRPKTRK